MKLTVIPAQAGIHLLGKFLARGWRWLTASSRAAQTHVYPHHETQGIGQEWTPANYGDYLAKSVPAYTAINIRATSMSQVPWRAYRTQRSGDRQELEPTHPLRLMLEQPNPWFTASELRYATETSLLLWGKAFWTLETSEDGQRRELWWARPDRMWVIPGQGRNGPYIRGYVYDGPQGRVAYLPQEVEYFRMFNPLEERSGLAPIAPLRLSLDLSLDATRYNRNTFRNGAIPDYLMIGEQDLTQQQVEEFYQRWEKRFSGPDNAHRPAIATAIKDVKSLAFSNRDLEYLDSLKWTLADASRVTGVPLTMMADLQFATLANMEALERQYWRNTIMPQTRRVSDRMNRSLLPKLGYPGLEVAFDFSDIQALGEDESVRIRREDDYLDRGVLTINEVRRDRGLPDVAWGNEPHFRQSGGFPPDPAAQPAQRSATAALNGHSDQDDLELIAHLLK